MPNEVLIIVKARNDTRAVFAQIRQDARNLGGEMGEDVSTNFSRSMREGVQREAANSGGDIARMGDSIGDSVSRRISERVTERLTRDVNGRLRDSRGRFAGGSSSESSSRSGGAGGRERGQGARA